MKTQNNNLLLAISKVETRELTRMVKETLAYVVSQKKSFTAADLWNIQRQKKSTMQRRHFA